MNAIMELQEVGDSIDKVKGLQDKCLDLYPENKTSLLTKLLKELVDLENELETVEKEYEKVIFETI